MFYMKTNKKISNGKMFWRALTVQEYLHGNLSFLLSFLWETIPVPVRLHDWR